MSLAAFIETIEDATGKKAIRNLLPAQPGDVPATSADVDALTDAVGFKPSTPLDVGLHRFVAWYRAFYKI